MPRDCIVHGFLIVAKFLIQCFANPSIHGIVYIIQNLTVTTSSFASLIITSLLSL